MCRAPGHRFNPGRQQRRPLRPVPRRLVSHTQPQPMPRRLAQLGQQHTLGRTWPIECGVVAEQRLPAWQRHRVVQRTPSTTSCAGVSRCPCSQRQACSTARSVTTFCGVVSDMRTWKEYGIARGRTLPLIFRCPRCRSAVASTLKPGTTSATQSICGGPAAARLLCLPAWHDLIARPPPCLDAGESMCQSHL